MNMESLQKGNSAEQTLSQSLSILVCTSSLQVLLRIAPQSSFAFFSFLTKIYLKIESSLVILEHKEEAIEFKF